MLSATSSSSSGGSTTTWIWAGALKPIAKGLIQPTTLRMPDIGKAANAVAYSATGDTEAFADIGKWPASIFLQFLQDGDIQII